LSIYDIIVTILIVITLIYGFILYYLKKNFRKQIIEIKRLINKLHGRRASELRKIRKRYIIFVILSGRNFTKKEIEDTVRETFTKYFGEQTLVKADPQLIYFEPSIQRGVIRTSHIYKDYVIASLGLIRKINDTPCLFIPLKTTGTIKRARKILYRLRRELQK